jgi:hypothetical protein
MTIATVRYRETKGDKTQIVLETIATMMIQEGGDRSRYRHLQKNLP